MGYYPTMVYYQRYHQSSVHALSRLDCRKIRSKWGVNLIYRLWHIIYIYWNHIYNVLYDTEVINRISGVDRLDVSIRKERLLGLDGLPSVYISYFHLPLLVLIHKPCKYKKKMVPCGQIRTWVFYYYRWPRWFPLKWGTLIVDWPLH